MQQQPNQFQQQTTQLPQPTQIQPSRKKKRGCVIALAVIGGLVVVGCGLILALYGYSYLRARSAFERGHQAFVDGDCVTALDEFATVEETDISEYVEQAAPEQEQCAALQAARDQQAAGNPAEALSAYLTYLSTYPDNSTLHQAASNETAALIEETPPDDLASDMLCDDLPQWLAYDVIPDPGDTIPALYLACADRAAGAGDHEAAFGMYLFVLEEHGSSPSAAGAESAVLDSPVLCDQIGSLLDASSGVRDRFDLAAVYLDCGADTAASGDYETAVRLYESFLAEYPDHPQAGEAEKALADALIAQARAAGAGQIAPPPISGSSGAGVTTVIIQNDSPESIRIVFSGSETRIEELAACPLCEIFFGVGPAFCPEQGPIGMYTLLPGVYEVLVESIGSDGTTPFTGTWTLADGDEYSSCFFIVRQFSP